MNNAKEYFKQYHENLKYQVWQLGKKLRILDFLVSCRDDEQNSKVWERFIEFFAPLEECLRTDIIVKLHNLFDERGSDKKNLIDYLKTVREYIPGVSGLNASDSRIKQLRDKIESQIKEAETLKPITASVKFSRDAYYAHFKRKYFDDPEALLTDKPLPFSDVVGLIDFCKNVLNWHYAKVIGCGVIIWSDDAGRKDLESLFSSVRTYERLYDEVGKRLGPGELLEMVEPKGDALSN